MGKYAGPVSCTDLGTGWEVERGDGAAVRYVFDDAGSLVAILDVRPDGQCRAGPADLRGLSCANFEVGYACAVDGGRLPVVGGEALPARDPLEGRGGHARELDDVIVDE